MTDGDEPDKVDFDGPIKMPRGDHTLPRWTIEHAIRTNGHHKGPALSCGPLAELTRVRRSGETYKPPVGSLYIVSETGELLSQTESPAGSRWVNIVTGAVVVPDQRGLRGRSWGFRFLWRTLGSILSRFRSVIDEGTE